jgi:single-strand DNA-binding protein
MTEVGTEPVDDRAAGAGAMVMLTGRLTAPAEERVLPSGDVMVAFRLSVPRTDTPLGRGSRQRSDWIDCVSAVARCRRSALGWDVGDEVAVEGVLRRRFLRGVGMAGTRLEVEVLAARRRSRGGGLRRPAGPA